MPKISRAIVQFLVLVALFFGSWFLLSRINYVGMLEMDKLSERQEHKLGDLLLDGLRNTHPEIKGDSMEKAVRVIRDRICKKNELDSLHIRVILLRSDEVNAFALPGNILVVYSGLIEFSKTPEEVAGAMAHEVAHIRKGHVMKKLTKEIGLSMLFALAGGNGSFEIIGEVLRTLSSRAFDRDQEREADMDAVHLLSAAGINPSGLSDFLFRISQHQEDSVADVELLSTHPDSGDRAALIISEIKKHPATYKPLDFGDWTRISGKENQ